MTILDSGRLWIRALTADQLHAALADPACLARELDCSIVPDLVSERARGAIGIKLGRMSQAAEQQHHWYTYWLLLHKEEKAGIGLAGFKGAPDLEQEAEIGYGIAPSYEGRGYMTEAVSALVGWAFLQPGCRAVTAETLKQNLPSQRVLAKTGFQVVRETDQELYWRIEKSGEPGVRG